MEPMKFIGATPEKKLCGLKRKAKKYGLVIRRYERRDPDSYMLVDEQRNAVATPVPMTLEQIELWLDDLAATESN